MSRSHQTRNGRRPRAARRILLVEDHHALATLRRAFLAEQGYEVVCAGNGDDARRLLQSQRFHLVVADAMLPPPGLSAAASLATLSGWEVAAAARRRGVPVILSSGWPVRLPGRQLQELGVDYLCPKPCSLNRLLHLVEAALKKPAAVPASERPARKPGTKGSVRKPR